MVDLRYLRDGHVNLSRGLRRARRIVLRIAVALILLALVMAAWLVLDARRTPTGHPEYVALGSSYAAGAGLGPRQPGSPRLCARSDAGYPPRLAERLSLSLVDMTCSGSVTDHVRNGGQFFQQPQIRTLSAQTRLVTVTVGGNDVGFVRDLFLLASRNSNTGLRWLVSKVWDGPPTMAERNFGKLRAELIALLDAIRSRAPSARVVVATYPAVLPPTGTCKQLLLHEDEAEMMRDVEDQLAAVTRAAAENRGALVVDMHRLGAGHSACSPQPWTRGWASITQSPFHPTLLGAQATADAVSAALRLP